MLEVEEEGTKSDRRTAVEAHDEDDDVPDAESGDDSSDEMAKRNHRRHLSQYRRPGWEVSGVTKTQHAGEDSARKRKTRKIRAAVRSTLLSGSPSRAQFPRGFLWDEGFHGLVFRRWDEELFMDIALDWLSLQSPTTGGRGMSGAGL